MTNPHTDPRRLMLFETAELVRELTNRHTACVIAYVECVDGQPDMRSFQYEVGGDVIANMGLAQGLVELTTHTFRKSVKRKPDNGPG